jgi:hypothetical protein
MKVVKLARKKREIERKLVTIIYKENVENTWQSVFYVV